jgi:anti-anti-sigma regulatory factor
MLRIDTIETASTITLELHGRLMGAWVPLLEALWRNTERHPAGRTIAVDLTDVTAIDGAGRYLLCLMEAKSVMLAGGGIGIRALLDGEQGLVLSDNDLKSPPGRIATALQALSKQVVQHGSTPIPREKRLRSK